MGISGGFDINDIANKLMGALDNIEEEGVKKGEKIGTKVGQAVREGLAEGLKDAEAEMMNTINQWVRNSKRKQSISLVEFKTNENLIRELMKTDKYANTLKESFKDLTATIDGLGEVKGLDSVLDALSKDEKALKKISFGPIKPAKKPKIKTEKDPEEAIKQLGKLEKDPWTIKEEEAVNNILKERLRILQKVGKEKIKAHDAEALERIIEVNQEYESRLNGFRETKDDSIYEQLGDQYGYYNDRLESALELQTLLSERLKRMKDIYFKDTDAYRNEQQVNKELQQRIENMQKIEDFQRKGFIEQKDVEDIVFELGTLDEKRSRLGGVQQDLFNLDDGDLDEAQLLLETYEKILVTTASGKKLTLGPDMTEEDYKAFMKIDAEKAKSIEFIRQEKQLAIQGMEEQAEATKKATDAQKKFNDEKEKAAKAQKNVQEEYLKSRKVYQVTSSTLQDKDPILYHTRESAEAAAKSSRDLVGSDAQVIEKTYGELGEKAREAFDRAYYNSPTNQELAGKKFVLSSQDMDTYLTMIEGRSDFKNQYKRLSELRTKGSGAANIQLNYNLIDALSYILDEDEMATEQEVELVERILRRRRSNEDLLKKIVGTENIKTIAKENTDNIDDTQRQIKANKNLVESYEKVEQAKSSVEAPVISKEIPTTESKDGQLTLKLAQDQLDTEKQITAEKQKQNELVAMHGISTKNLLTALDQGAFSSPSIAVTKPDIYSGGYGDATVVFKKSAIDPALNPANKIYGVDAYTPTHPSFGYELNEEALAKAAKRTGIAVDTLRAACDGAFESVEDAAKSLSGNVSIGQQLQEAFIKELGIDLKTTETDGKILNRFHVVSDDEIINGVPDFIAQEGITFDKIVNDDAIQQAYFDAIDKYVANNNEYFADFAPGQIKQVLVDEFKNSIRQARTDKSIYDEEKEYFENDQAVLRGQKKIVDVAARNDEIQRIISEKRKEYNGYVKEVLESFMVKPNTIGANGQRFDRTPEGIAMAMSSYGGKGALYDENAFMRRDIDLQSFIIAASKTYQSLDEVVLDMERLQKDATGTHTLSNTDYSISAITSSIAKANNIEDEIAFDKILRAVDGNSTADTIGKALADSGLTVDKSTVEKIAALAQEALKVPTKYFEAKPQRALGLEDIEFVSIPTDSPQSSELKSKLQEKGIKYVEHTSTDDASRAAALKARMQQIDLIKEETALQEELNQTRRDAPESQQAEIVVDNEKAAVSYEELRQAVERFNQVAAKGNNATDEEYAEGRKAESYLLDTVGLDNTLASMNEDGTLNLNALAQYLGIEIPQAADKAIDAIRQTEQAAEAMDSSQSNNTNLLEFSVDRSNPMVANAFNGMNIKDWIKAYVQPDARGQLQDELYKLAQSVLPEYDSNVFDAQLEHIVDFIIKNSQRRETKEPNMYDDLFKQLVVTYTDEDAAAMGPQLFEEAKNVLGRRLQKRNDRNGYISGIDQLVSQIADSDYRSMFSDPDGNESQYNKFEELLKVFAKWKEDSKRKTKDVSLTERDAPDVENNILENIVPQMMANMGATAAKLEDEQLGFEGVAASSEKAAKGKRKFTEANKKAGPSASDSAEDFEDEADALDKINTSAEKIPGKYDSVTKYMIGNNTDPSTAVQKRVRLVNNIIQNETQRLSANDSGGWDVDVTSVNEQKLRGMRDFISDYKKEAKKLDSINTDIRFTGKDGIDANFQASIDKYLLAMANLRNAFNNLQANPDDAGLAQVFDDAKKSVQDARTEVEGYLKQSQKLKQEYKGKEIANPITINASDVKNVQSAMMSFASSIEGTSFQFTKFSADGTKMFGTLDDGSGVLRNITVGLDQASGQLHIWENAASNAGHATANLTNQWEDFRTQIIDGAKRIAGMYIGVQEFMQAFRTGFNYVKEIDLAMTELKKVTDETDASYKQFLEDAAGTSGIIGSTISDFTEAAANFARLGYSMEEAASMAETAIVYKNVADGLDTVEESTESIISTMKAFGIESSGTMSIIDRFNEVGKFIARR